MALADELGRLAELRASGGLTDEEFSRAKERLLNGEPPARPHDPFTSAVSSFRRSRTDRWIGGVCGGIARSTGVESWAWRLIFTTLFICGGVGFLLYLLLWLFVPSD
jgi:phage shock protein PspC (stress-responsive transcriptional regulator)